MSKQFLPINTEPSQLRSYLLALDFVEPENEDEVAMIQQQRQSLDAIKLPPLHLPQLLPAIHRSSVLEKFIDSIAVNWYLPILSSLLLFTMMYVSYYDLEKIVSPALDIRLKGMTTSWVYWERQGVVQEWQPDHKLQNGDRVRAEIFAPTQSIAVWGVVSDQQQLITTATDILDSQIWIPSLSRKAFDNSLKLVGNIQNEDLFILSCVAGNQVTGQALLHRVLASDQSVLHKLKELPKDCQIRYFKLR